MKKWISIMMTCAMVLVLCACNDSTTTHSDVDDQTTNKSEIKEISALVVYFSNTGNTKAIAEHIAKGKGATLFEIKPKEPYTDDDLDYNDDNSRSTEEMNDSSARPEIANTVEDFDKYDTVYIGYPIWWGEAPRIMSTFVESYDLGDKTVIPFCTSSSSGIGSSDKNLEKLSKSGKWLEGKRFSGDESQDEVMEWVNGL